LAPKRRDDDVEQRAYPGPGQGRHPRVRADRLAGDAARLADVRLGGYADKVLPDWHAHHLVGHHRQSGNQRSCIVHLCIPDAKAICRYGTEYVQFFKR